MRAVRRRLIHVFLVRTEAGSVFRGDWMWWAGTLTVELKSHRSPLKLLSEYAIRRNILTGRIDMGEQCWGKNDTKIICTIIKKKKKLFKIIQMKTIMNTIFKYMIEKLQTLFSFRYDYFSFFNLSLSLSLFLYSISMKLWNSYYITLYTTVSITFAMVYQF